MKSLRWAFLIFLSIGLVFLIVSAYTAVNTRSFIQTASKGEGEVIDNLLRGYGRNRTYYPRVRFRTIGGQQYEFEGAVGSRPPSFRVGESVAVLYDPENPGKARIASFGSLWVFPLVFGILGTVFTGIGAIPLYRMKRRKELDQWLMSNGHRVIAELERVDWNRNLRVNGRSPYRIVCQWLEPSRKKLHVFRSHHIWFNPEPYMKGKTVIVMIDPANPRRYVVDTSFLPELAE